MIFVSICSI